MQKFITIAALSTTLLSGAVLAEPFNERGGEPYVNAGAGSAARQMVQADLTGFNNRSGSTYVAAAPAAADGQRVTVVLTGHNDKSDV